MIEFNGILRWSFGVPTTVGMGTQVSIVGVPGDCVTFALTHSPTCYRRGPWKLHVEICEGERHHDWGCFDDQDQPIRWYHSEGVAKLEAASIATVLVTDRNRWERNKAR